MTNDMILSRRRLLASAGLLAVAPWRAVRADQPIRLVVPFPAGGGTDTMGRLLAQELGKELAATVIVDNLSGATGTIGAAQVARAAPDGRTLLLGPTATMAIAPALFKGLRYDTATDFVALAHIAHGGSVVAANPSFPANTVPEMVALAKRTGEPMVYASWGNGSAGHLAMESICTLTGIKMVHAPYKGAAPLIQDLIGGQIQVGMVDVAGALPQIRAGKIKALAVTGRKRSSALPQVPTLKEGGIAFDTESWYGLFGPAHMPEAETQKIAQAAARVMRRPEVTARIRDLGLESDPIARADFDKEWHADIATWARLVQKTGAKVD